MATEDTVTGLALKEASSTTNYNKQNVHYKMKYNATTKQWEQEEIMTPLVPMVYPGIKTKDGKVKDISGGLKDAPVVKPITTPDIDIAQPGFPSTPETPITAPSTGIGGYQQAQQDYSSQVSGSGMTTSGGIQYEPSQVSSYSESLRDNMKYNVMPGGYNSQSDAQVLSQSLDGGILQQLLNPTVKDKNEKTKMEALGSLPVIGGISKIASFMGPRSEKAQIDRLLKSGMITLTNSQGQTVSTEDAFKILTQDDKGKLKILKGEDLINSGYKITQNKKISDEYSNSPAFMNLQEDKANNFVSNTGTQLTTLNPVMGSSGTTLFGFFDEAKGSSHTNGEQVLVVDADGGGAYNSEGKFVGQNGQIYAFGTAEQAMQSAMGGVLPADVLERMTDENGKLKDLYTDPSSQYYIDSSNVVNGVYVGDVVLENRDRIDNGGNGNVVGSTAPDGSQDKQDNENKQNQVQDDIRDEVADDLEDIYGDQGIEEPSPPTTEDSYLEASGAQGGSNNDSGSDNSSSSKDKKIVCTEMYRQTQLDDWQRTIKLWYIFQQRHLSETHQKGYHFLFRPYVKGMQKSSILTSIGKHMAQERTKDIKHIMYGTEFSLKGRVYRTILEPICYIVGLFIRG